MANFSIFSKRLGLKKESVRGVAETTPDSWIAISKDSELTYVLNLLADETIRGVSAAFKSAPGTKDGKGSLKLPVRAQNVGEFFQMLVGNPTSVQQGATTAYKHTFTPDNTLLLPTYTLFLDRGLNILKYDFGSVAQIKLSSVPDGFVAMEVEVMFQAEVAGAIGSPTYTESEEFSFQHITFKIAGASNTEVKSWECSLLNGLFAKRTFTQSQDIGDFVAVNQSASGSFIIYFTDVVERDKFLAGTTSSIQILVEGDTIESPYKYTLDLTLDEIQYKAFPYGEQDGLLAASVTWEAFYNNANTRLYKVDLINTKTAY